jgi:oligopeptide/dipeptide ABC transporter ATP-binding protein
VPRLGNGAQEVAPIAGSPPDLARLPSGCAFYDRCAYREAKCREQDPPLEQVGEGHLASCWVDIRSEPRPQGRG